MAFSDKKDVDCVTKAIANFGKRISGKRLLLAYSGGVDSHILLHGMSRIASANRIEMTAVHFNHQVSPQSNLWEQHCLKVCNSLTVSLMIQRSLGMVTETGGPENSLRVARYDWFRSIMSNGDILVTAHQMDDQIETILFRLFRGGGVRGLTGIPDCRKFGPGELHRPLLGVTRPDILSAAKYFRLQWIEDSSNYDDAFDRNFIRKEIVPVIRSRWPAAVRTIGRTAKQLNAAERLLGEFAERDFSDIHLTAVECQFRNFGKLNVNEIRNLSENRTANLLRYWVRRAGYEVPSSRQLSELLRQLRVLDRPKNIRIKSNGSEFRCYRDYLYLMPAQNDFKGRIVERTFVGDELAIPETRVKLGIVNTVGRGIRLSGLDIGNIEVTSYSKRAKIKLVKDQKRRRLSNLFQELGIPPWERKRIPVLSIGEQVIHVPGLGSTVDLLASADEAGVQFLLEEI